MTRLVKGGCGHSAREIVLAAMVLAALFGFGFIAVVVLAIVAIFCK